MLAAVRTSIRLSLVLAILLCAADASAEIYKYQTESGEILISTQKRRDLKLVEIVSSSPKVRRASQMKGRTQKKRTKDSGAHRQDARNTVSRDAREAAFDDIITEAAEEYDVPFGFVKAVIRVESNFNPNAVSKVGAMGLMQLMPRTAASLNVRNAFDPRQNIYGGAKFLRILIDRYDGDINLILAAYNAGDAAVARYDGIPYPKTRGYVSSVFRWYQHYSAEATEQ